jgi:methionyl aminopeptidase
MIKLKTKEEIEILAKGGKILSSVLDEVENMIKPGVATGELNDLAEKLIEQSGGKAAFKGYKASWGDSVFPAALCVSVNHEVVHGIPKSDMVVKEGDIVGIDCGLEYEGMFTDMARTIIVGEVAGEIKKLVSVTKDALMKGIAQVKPGNRISDISKAIEGYVEDAGFSLVRQLVGHGVGYSAHEDPQVPNYFDKNIDDVELKEGLVIAIEPMVNIGDWPIETEDDQWTIVTADKSISAHFEHTVAVTEDGYKIITK